ncbi:hypothetical protein SEA_OPIE_24 [Gordonia phage Opie]|nr:hypothetical protein SEA_OPIE_24 [Gordonia phage Opie]
MWWRKGRTPTAGSEKTAHAIDERSKENARRAEVAETESDRLAATARPIQATIADQLERNHWAMLIFGRVN